jgi:hypothetical protein
MSERDRQAEREVDTDFESGVDLPQDSVTDRPSEATRGDRVRTRIRAGAGNVLSGRAFAISLVLTVAGVVFLGGLLPLGIIGNFFSLLVAGFLYGLVTPAGRYAELGLAGAVVGAGSAQLGNLVLSVLPGVPLILLGLIGGGASALAGHYFGRDLRDGLTREI